MILEEDKSVRRQEQPHRMVEADEENINEGILEEEDLDGGKPRSSTWERKSTSDERRG